MARNRFKGQAPTRRVTGALGRALGLTLTALRPAIRLTLFAALIGGLSYAAWQAIHRSPYFLVRTIDVAPTPHLDRPAIITLIGLDRPANLFDFDADAARDALLTHPWVATARVEKVLPETVIVRLEERRPSGAVVLDTPYLVDATGHPFAAVDAASIGGLPIVTGLDRQDFDADPEATYDRVRTALAITRAYAQSPLAARHPLGNVHLAPGGRTELMLGKTRVALGHGEFRDKIGRLQQILDALDARKVDAAYILLSEDLRRAIVKEIPRERGLGDTLLHAQEQVN